jgi:hypothetical protein
MSATISGKTSREIRVVGDDARIVGLPGWGGASSDGDTGVSRRVTILPQ